MPSQYSNRHYILGTAFAIAALCVPFWLYHPPHFNIEAVLSGLHRLEASYRPFPQPQPGPLVIVGFGGCTDVTVNALTFFEPLEAASHTARHSHRSPNASFELNSLEDVVDDFTQMLAAGAAAERYVRNHSLFELLVTKAISTVTNPNRLRETAERGTLSLGGNAPVMATRLAREGAEVTLVARLSSRETQALPSSVKVLAAPSNFGLPETPKTDVHLVLEYDKGAVWRNNTAPRANRYILIRDEENPRLSSLWPGLMSSWRKWGNHGGGVGKDEAIFPDLLVVGGLQTMDNAVISPDIRGERMEALRHLLAVETPRATLVHFEMASFVETNFVANLTRTLLPYVDSIGLNEQELPNLRSLLSEGRVASQASVSTPRAAVMLDEMREIWSLLAHPTQLPRVGVGLRRLSRLHLHTLGYQIIMVQRPAAAMNIDAATADRNFASDQRATELGFAWPFARAAAAKASLIAHRHTCATASIDPELTRLLMDDSFAVTANPARWPSALHDGAVPRIRFDPSAPVSCWFEAEPVASVEGGGRRAPGGDSATRVEICVAPVPVCRRVTRTVGGGDNISAAALRTQLVERKRSFG
ncbi:putative ADP-dependent glucokinase [Echinococcus granulosus]|uniref:ADP dependent glucokinase n=1 Tax=Echinococcus granulosus TaxID=6210 RepID=U6JAA9_ECHGR|nr:putative ADP-dependent glucokinase [Echinococcus granulosus]EUB55916.1 putative ADP-dependent glucokinase [Echinococcus granulosus]KAH9279133.1 putative ADP-dependent glucokinase [Echinococcus granulosus]CDS21025.1 ADP dependent glucokinase [Echinococcus granulosus]